MSVPYYVFRTLTSSDCFNDVALISADGVPDES